MKTFIKSREGFTLIELLVVIGIIGLLASVVLVGLSGARRSGRDARRISDLKSIQTALELYYNRCNYYPGPLLLGACPSYSGTPDFNTMKAALLGSNLGINSVPNNPSGQSYKYVVVGGAGQEYVLQAVLEDPQNNALLDDIDGNPGGLDCTGPNYCIGVTSYVPGSVPVGP